jgi:choline dehydrogenase
MQNEVASGSSILTPGVEVIICTLTATHEFYEVVVNPNGDNRALGSKWRLYELLPSGPALVWEGTITPGNINRADRITPAVNVCTPYSGVTAGAIVQLRAEGVGKLPTLVAVNADLTGYDPSCCAPISPFPPGALVADYVVVGLGTAGCGYARFITENLTSSCIALESGDFQGATSEVLVPGPFRDTTMTKDPKFHWQRQTDVRGITFAPPNDGRTYLYTDGKMWGGSSGHNFGLTVRGTPDIYNGWGAVNPQWLYASLLPVMKFMEHFVDNGSYVPSAVERGFAGPLWVLQDPPLFNPPGGFISFLGTAANTPVVDDYNNPLTGDVGVGPFQAYIDPGTFTRSWAQTAFLPSSVVTPAGVGVGARKLSVISRATVDKILFDTTGATPKAIGVRVEVQSDPPRFVDVYANVKIVLCAGSIADVAILQRSGIGDPAILSPLGIPTIFSNPNVGLNLQAHYGPIVTIPASFINPPPFAATHAMEDLTGGATYPLGAATGIRENQTIGFPGMDDGGNLIFSAYNFLMRPTDGGTIQITTKDPSVAPLVTFNMYPGGADRANAVKTIKMWANVSMAYTGLPPISPPPASFPAPIGAQPDDVALETYCFNNSIPTNHASGTCKMDVSVAAGGVVDGNLNVFGVTGLAVADLAIQPKITTGNTSYPAFVIGLMKAKIDGATTPY